MDRLAQPRNKKENGAPASRVSPPLAAAIPCLPGTGPEANLVMQARRGDRDAFSCLVSGHLQLLYRLARRITKNHEDAEDVVQDALLKAHANLSRFEGRARFSTWITRITINEALMKQRRFRHRKHIPWDDLTQSEEFDAGSNRRDPRQANPEALYARMEIREGMLRAARSLLPMYRTVFLLTRVRGCTNQETADELELSVATVRARLHRASKQLREKLTPIGGALPC